MIPPISQSHISSHSPGTDKGTQKQVTDKTNEVAQPILTSRILNRREGLGRLIIMANEAKLSQKKDSGFFQKIMNIFNSFKNFFAFIGSFFYKNNQPVNVDISENDRRLSEASTKEIGSEDEDAIIEVHRPAQENELQFQTMNDVLQHETFSTNVHLSAESDLERICLNFSDSKLPPIPLDNHLFEESSLASAQKNHLPTVPNPAETFLSALNLLPLDQPITSLDQVVDAMRQHTYESYHLTEEFNEKDLQKLYKTKVQIQKDFNRWNQVTISSGDEHFSIENLLTESRNALEMQLLHRENPAAYRLLIANKMQLCLQETLLKHGFNTPALLETALDNLHQGIFALSNKNLMCFAANATNHNGVSGGHAKLNIRIESNQLCVQASFSEMDLMIPLHPDNTVYLPTGDLKTKIILTISPDQTSLTKTVDIGFSQYDGIFHSTEDKAFYKQLDSIEHR